MGNNVINNKRPHSLRYGTDKGMGMGIKYIVLLVVELFLLFHTDFMLVSSIKNN